MSMRNIRIRLMSPSGSASFVTSAEVIVSFERNGTRLTFFYPTEWSSKQKESYLQSIEESLKHLNLHSPKRISDSSLCGTIFFENEENIDIRTGHALPEFVTA